MKKNIYITTPIYYVNDKPHIGHAYTSVLADVICRYQKLMGKESFFLTGTDEHGQKVKQAAIKKGISPLEQADECHLRFKNLWKKLGIQYDRFIRTTETMHYDFVQSKLKELHQKGEIYEKTYTGWYSVGEERFFSDNELVNGKDPISHRAVEWLEEKNYFFKMSKYQETLIKHIKTNPKFIIPNFRSNEVLGFLKKPLNDLCISRPKHRLDWGIPLPFDNDFVTYVWFDALFNYQSAIQGKHYSDKSPLWPADYHLIGKDILTTHAVYWSTMLMALGETLPRHILAHGWWLTDQAGEKLSKTSGNALEPSTYIEKYGSDSLRYFLMRNMTLGQDARFSNELLVHSINRDLANDLGNAINRIHKLIHSSFAGKIPKCNTESSQENITKAEEELKQFAMQCIDNTQNLLSQFKLSQLIEEIIASISQTNRYIDKSAPWKLAKKIKNNLENTGDAKDDAKDIESSKNRLAIILYHAA